MGGPFPVFPGGVRAGMPGRIAFHRGHPLRRPKFQQDLTGREKCRLIRRPACWAQEARMRNLRANGPGDFQHAVRPPRSDFGCSEARAGAPQQPPTAIDAPHTALVGAEAARSQRSTPEVGTREPVS